MSEPMTILDKLALFSFCAFVLYIAICVGFWADGKWGK